MQADVDADPELGPLCPGYLINLSENQYDEGDDHKYKIDASFIKEEDRERLIPNVPNWPLQKLSAEFKRGGTSLDPYNDKKGQNVESQTDSRLKVGGQIMSYSNHVFVYQHRIALFFIFINGDEFRMMRWDHSGHIVTEATNYVTNLHKTRVMLELLYSFSKLSREQQGEDPTVVQLSPESCGWKRMDELAAAHPYDLDTQERDIPLDDPQVEGYLNPHPRSAPAYLFENNILPEDPTQPAPSTAVSPSEQTIPDKKDVRDLFRSTLAPEWPRYQISVRGRKYLAGKPIFKSSGVVGRGTRGYVALDWAEQRLVFLKDTWRPFYTGLLSEGAILKELNERGVRYVPTYLLDEDIPGQETLTSSYSPTTGSKTVLDRVGSDGGAQGRELRHLCHYRMVVKEVCIPSTNFENGRQLARAVYHCILGAYPVTAPRPTFYVLTMTQQLTRRRSNFASSSIAT